MRVILGAYYENNSGKVVRIIDKKPDPVYPFVGDDGYRYTPQGEVIPEVDCVRLPMFQLLVEKLNLRKEVLL